MQKKNKRVPVTREGSLLPHYFPWLLCDLLSIMEITHLIGHPLNTYTLAIHKVCTLII